MKFSKSHIREMMRYVQVVPDVMPKELCNDIIKEYCHSPYWEAASTGDGNKSQRFRNCCVLPLGEESHVATHKRALELDDAIFNCSKYAIDYYRGEFPNCHIEEDTGYDMLRYTKGGYYTQHCDSFLKEPRAVSCSFALNDNFEGGEWCFFDNTVRMRVEQGQAVMFPSDFLFPHAIAPVTKGTRYSIITWFR
jgi:hypothetical protein